MSLPERLRAIIEAHLSWYDPEREARRDARSARVHRQSIAARITAEKAMKLESYRRVSARR